MRTILVNSTNQLRKESMQIFFVGLSVLAMILVTNTAWAHSHKNHKTESHSHADHKHEEGAKVADKDQAAKDSKSDVEKPNDVIVNVNGMVCSFCTSNIEKRFKKEKAVKDVLVNLDEKKVYLSFKENSSLTDAQITTNIKKAGYNVVSIERN